MRPLNSRDEDIQMVAQNLQSVQMPVFITLGNIYEDPQSVKFFNKILMPTFKTYNTHFEYKVGYPGNHKWFWSVHDEHWRDIEIFLNKYL